METINKVYVGKVEALEFLLERGVFELPRKGTENLTVHAIASGLNIEVCGKDENGYYLAEQVPA